MNDLNKSYSIDPEIINKMNSKELDNLMAELTYLNKQIQNRKKVVIEPGGVFQQIYNILTSKRSKLKNKIELDVTEAIEVVSSILPILMKDIRSIEKKQDEMEKKLHSIQIIVISLVESVYQNPIQLPPEIENELFLMIDPSDSSFDRPDNKKTIPYNEITESTITIESNGNSDFSNEQIILDIIKKHPKMRKKRGCGCSGERIEEQYSRKAVYAKTKTELKEYIKNKEPEIIVEGKLAKQLKKCEPLKNATPAKIAALSASVGAVGATIAAMIITGGPTIGISYFVGAPAIVAEAGIIGSTFGVGTVTAITMLILASSISVGVLVSIFKDYDTEFEGNIGHVCLKLKRKKEK